MRKTFNRVVVLLILGATLLGHATLAGDPRPRYYTGLTSGAVVDGPAHDGAEILVDLPVQQHVRNFGAPKDGLGLCVFASMDMTARWHRVGGLIDVIHKVDRGGGWPEKVDTVIRQNAPELKYVQYQGNDLAVLDRAIAARHPVCVTYGYSERYGMKTIYHMVVLVHLDEKYAVILDNNFPGTYEWMSREEFSRRWAHPQGQGWAYFFLAPTPPPIPSN